MLQLPVGLSVNKLHSELISNGDPFGLVLLVAALAGSQAAVQLPEEFRPPGSELSLPTGRALLWPSPWLSLGTINFESHGTHSPELESGGQLADRACIERQSFWAPAASSA